MEHESDGPTPRVFLHVADPARRAAIRSVLVAHGWTTVEVIDDGPPPDLLLLELGDRLGPVRHLAEAHPHAVVLLLADYLSPVVLVAAHTLRASAVLTQATPLDELPIVLAAHWRSASVDGEA